MGGRTDCRHATLTCAVLSDHGVKIAPSTHRAARKRPPSTSAVRHAALPPEVVRVQTSKEAGRGLCGARKVWQQQLLREHANIRRRQVKAFDEQLLSLLRTGVATIGSA